MTEEIYLERLKLIRADPMVFLSHVRTLDEVDRKNPIKNFPVELDYVQLFVQLWLRDLLIAVPKSRRMKASWTTIGLYTWDTIFNVGRHQAFVSKKDDDSDALVKRSRFILENFDYDFLPKEFFPKWRYTENLLEVPELNSKIEGYPSGADQLRQFTFSGMFFDELAFWQNAQEAYSASMPTLDGGGRATMVSSAAAGFFKLLVFDQLNKGLQLEGDASSASELKPRKRLFPMPGVEIWKNPENRFTVMELHYTADPAKRTPEYKAKIRSSLPYRDYMREYEITWETWAGMPVYGDWETKAHGEEGDLAPHLGLPILRGWDFGLTPACILAQLQGEKLVVFKEFVAFNMGIERFSDLVLSQCALLYPSWVDQKKDWVDFIDPAGYTRAQTDEKTCAQILQSKKIKTHAGAISWTQRKEAVEFFLTKRTKDGACLQVSLSECPMFVKGFKGGYQYPDNAENMEANEMRPLKNEYSHIHDAFQMIASGIRTRKKSTGVSVPTPSYSKNS